MFQISANAKDTHLKERLQYSRSVLSIYTSGFRKHKSNIHMANNYVLLGRFHWPCKLACFVVDFDYFEIKNMARRLTAMILKWRLFAGSDHANEWKTISRICMSRFCGNKRLYYITIWRDTCIFFHYIKRLRSWSVVHSVILICRLTRFALKRRNQCA